MSSCSPTVGDALGEGAIAFRSDGVGFLAENHTLYTFDIVVGTSSIVGRTNRPAGGIDGLDFDGSDMLFVKTHLTSNLFTIDQGNAATIGIGSIGPISSFDVDKVSGLTFRSDRTLWVEYRGSLVTVNPTTGSIIATIGPVTGVNISGLTWLVPEPSTVILAAMGFVGLLAFGWRRLRKLIPTWCAAFVTRLVPRDACGPLVVLALYVPFFSGLLPQVDAASFSFSGLGDLPGGRTFSVAGDISTDGSVVAGRSTSESGSEAFRWTSDGGLVGLGHLPNGNHLSDAFDVSADGSVIVGQSDSAFDVEAFRWTDGGGMVGLGVLSGGGLSAAIGVSADGSVVVGYSGSTPGFQAFRWIDGEGMVGLGDLPGGSFDSVAAAVSGDGAVVVGRSDSALGREAFRWTEGEGMVGLGDLSGGSFDSVAAAVVAEGAVIVGRGNSALGAEAFRWTSDSGMVGLGDMPGGVFASYALAASADGAVVVGEGSGPSGGEAFVWTAHDGMKSLRDVLAAGGVTGLANWKLAGAWGISEDGRTIVGNGINPNGDIEVWVATIPEPSTVILAAIGLVGLLAFRRRRRMR